MALESDPDDMQQRLSAAVDTISRENALSLFALQSEPQTWNAELLHEAVTD